MGIFTEWLLQREQRLGGMDQLHHILNDVRLGVSNSLANASPQRGLTIDFGEYIQKLQQAAQIPEAQPVSRALMSAAHALSIAGERYAEAKRQAGFQGGGEFVNKHMQPVWDAANRALQIVRDIMTNGNKSVYTNL